MPLMLKKHLSLVQAFLKHKYLRLRFNLFYEMDTQFETAQSLGAQKYSRNSAKFLQYGTAGFREKSNELPHVMYRMGLLAVLRSKVMNGATVGLMITASHNPEEDNGVKLCDPDSKMLDKEWELLAAELINTDNKSLKGSLKSIVALHKINYDLPAHVFLARDTRSSSEFLLQSAIDGINCLKGEFKSFGLLTTPQLHFVVYCENFPSYGAPTADGYYEKLSKAFEILRSSSKENKRYSSNMFIDGANGIGALKFRELQNHITSLNAKVFNDGTVGKLNFKCGADFVKVEQKTPEGSDVLVNERYASFDGDADRLVYFYRDISGSFHLLDGDKIATLVSKFLKDLVDSVSLSQTELRVVQTAYANGSSTKYIENNLKIPVICVPTGVKHLHHEAMQYDIGIYFEANGHGTVVFDKNFKQNIQIVADSESAGLKQNMAARKFLSVIDLINETVGDAISDLLLVEVILHDYDWSIEDWDKMYADLPNRQLKVRVPDRNEIETTDAERKCVKPEGLQKAIESIVSSFSNARSFVRPSGTEDVVRVYAEAETQEQADNLALSVKKLVEQFTQST